MAEMVACDDFGLTGHHPILSDHTGGPETAGIGSEPSDEPDGSRGFCQS